MRRHPINYRRHGMREEKSFSGFTFSADAVSLMIRSIELQALIRHARMMMMMRGKGELPAKSFRMFLLIKEGVSSLNLLHGRKNKFFFAAAMPLTPLLCS